jgi:anaerobic ribonucleoside-triphosphate reductase activating protein
MQIDRIYYPVETPGYGKRLGIWTIGCPHNCNNCSNPELQNINTDKDIVIDDLAKIIWRFKDKIDGVTITGGDPFYQYAALLDLLKTISNIGIIDVLVYTGYTLNEIKKLNWVEALEYIGVLVDGKYETKLDNGIGIIGSQNQEVYILKAQLKEKYADFKFKERKSQIVNYNGELWSIGIPKKKEKNKFGI